jgi:putative ABC transport system permease protein
LRLIWITLKNLKGGGFRNLAIFFSVMGVAGFLLATTLVIAGAQNSLNSGLKRLGADILVVPSGAETKVETALLMGKPANVWMPKTNLQEVANIPGVEAVSPQVYLSSLFGASCCAVSEMFMVVYDPSTDFTVTPWLEKNLGRGLTKGEVVGGTYVFVPEDEKYLKLYGYDLTLKGNINATGTGMDQTLFMTSETAQAVAQSSLTTAVEPLKYDPKNISAILVKVVPGTNPHSVSQQILLDTQGMVPIESPDLFGTFRTQMNGLLWGFFFITVIIWIVAVVLIAIVFSLAANERRREMAVLRALGATRKFIFTSMLTEASVLAVSGAVIGIAIAALGLYIFKDMIAGSLKIPFLFPSIPAFIGYFGAGVGAAIITVALAALIPAIRLSRQELAIAMRE